MFDVNLFIKDVETVTLLKAREVGESVQLNMASRILDRALRNISSSSNTLTVSCLKDIAGIRAALDVLSTYLSDDCPDNVERHQALSKCLVSAKQLCSNTSRFVVQLFLLKQFVRHDPNGIDAVKERCRKEELKWIMPPQAGVMHMIIFKLNDICSSRIHLRMWHLHIYIAPGSQDVKKAYSHVHSVLLK